MTRNDAFEVTLYARPGCHLCEQAEADLARLQSRYPHKLRIVDITRDEDLVARYGETIPVLVIQQREYTAPLWPETIERAFAATASTARPSSGCTS